MRLVVVTPAGRERYLGLLAHYVLGSPVVSEWQLWDNCRTPADRAYLQRLAATDARCTIKRLAIADGSNDNIGDFFRFCDDPEALYLRLDDDIVFTEPGFFEKFLARALAQRGAALWFAPLIVNNAVCSGMLKTFSQLSIEGPVSFQAMDADSWGHAAFPLALHPVLIEAARSGRLDAFRVPDRDIRLGRFSINALAFFGDEIRALGDGFLPPDRNEEEWLSAILPARLDRPGRVLGDLLVAHFAFYPQERELLRSDVLERYYELAGLPVPAYDKPRDTLGVRYRRWRRQRRAPPPRYAISLPA